MQQITLEMNVQPQHRNHLLSWLEELFVETRQAPGCVYINAYTADDEPNRIIFIEEWETAENYQAYLSGRIESGVLGKIQAMLSDEPKITYWNKSAA